MTEGLSASTPLGGVSRRVVLRALAAGAIGAAVAGCQAITSARAGGTLTKASVALDWYPWSNHAGLLLARDDGNYGAEGLDVNLYVPSNPADGLKLVASGHDTFTISYQTDVLLAREQSIPVKSIAALVQHPLNTIMALKTSGIAAPKQLEGKKVGMAGLPSDDAYLETMMRYDGGDPSKAQKITVNYDLVQALITKQVDAIVGGYWCHESILCEEKGFPVNVLRVEQWGVPDYYELVLVASDSTIQNNTDLVRRFLRATVQGYGTAMKDHAKALAALFKDSPDADKQMETKGIELLAPEWVDKSGRFGVQDPSRWDTFAKWMQSQGLLKGSVKATDAYATGLVP